MIVRGESNYGEKNLIEQFYTYYDTENLCYKNQINTEDFCNNSFVIKMRLSCLSSDGGKIIFEVPSVLKICVLGLNRNRDEEKIEEDAYEKGELLFLYCDENGYVPVLRTEIYTQSEEHPDWNMFSLSVPMAVKTDDNRVIVGGWLYGYGWGSVIVHRELLQFEKGILGMRWLPELSPKPCRDNELYRESNVQNGSCFAVKMRKSYYVECKVLPEKNGAIALGFSGEGSAFRLLIDSAEKTAEINFWNKTDIFDGERILPPHLLVPKLCGDNMMVHQLSDADLPCRAKNFCLANLRKTDEPYSLKVVLHYEKKPTVCLSTRKLPECARLFSIV